MKQLYSNTFDKMLVGHSKNIKEHIYSDVLHYGELPEAEEKIYTLEQIENGEGEFYTWPAVFKKNKKISLDFCSEKMKFSDLVCAKIYCKAEPIDDRYYTFEKLAKKLSATEFIDWCKDNGLTVCPIGK